MDANQETEIDYMGIEFPEGTIGETQRENFHRISKRTVYTTRYPDPDALRSLGLMQSVAWMLRNLGMTRFCSMSNNTCVRLTYEFLSSLRYVSDPNRTSGTIYFRMFNADYSLTHERIREIFLFPSGEGFATIAPLESDWDSEAFAFWRKITNTTTEKWEGLKATTIQNPAIRYLHRILSSTIFCRENTGNLNSKDLFFIHCALNQISVDPTPFLLTHLISVANRVTGSICVGGIITAIANALELEPALELADTLLCLFVDLDFCKNMRLVKTLPNGKYHVMIRTREILDFTLPNPSRI